MQILEVSVQEYSLQRSHVLRGVGVIDIYIVLGFSEVLRSLDSHLGVLLESWLIASH